MKRLLLSSACCCLAAALASAAIITERNDVYDGAGCYPPPAYTFIGTPSRPGIDSCWIPYGTYTGGVAGTEYLRVTSNLMGVVASALGGAAERAYVTGGYYSPTVSDGFGDWPTLLRPITAPPQSWDWGEYLETATNTSLRIADQLNWGIMYKRTGPESGSSAYPVYPESIEPLLAKTDNYYGYYTFNGGIAGSFGSRVLDDLTGNAQPPISPNWTTAIPFDVAKSNLWRNVADLHGMHQRHSLFPRHKLLSSSLTRHEILGDMGGRCVRRPQRPSDRLNEHAFVCLLRGRPFR